MAGEVLIEKEAKLEIASSPINVKKPIEQSIYNIAQRESISPESQFYENLLKGVQTFSPLIIPFIIHYLQRSSRKKVSSPA